MKARLKGIRLWDALTPIFKYNPDGCTRQKACSTQESIGKSSKNIEQNEIGGQNKKLKK